jgi:hypothetical protein
VRTVHSRALRGEWSPSEGSGDVTKTHHGVQSHLETRAKAVATLVLEVSVGWVSPSSRGLPLPNPNPGSPPALEATETQP